MTEHKISAAEAQALADATAEAMWSRDRAAQALGLKIVRVQPGASLLTMVVRGDMVDGHHICHGGMIFSLADTAFAYACNSYNKNTKPSPCSAAKVIASTAKSSPACNRLTRPDPLKKRRHS